MFVRHPRAKCYVVRVRDDGSVRVTIPRGGSRREAQQFLAKQHDWIARQRRRLELDRAAAPPPLAPTVERALRARAARELPQRTFELARQHGLDVSRVSVRNQKWRWGSCSRSGHICLNWRLAAVPAWVRDYVIVHELMHLKRMDHSSRFWRLVARVCPQYRQAREWLRHYDRCGPLPVADCLGQ
jgi:predicted metal-dependent hydrolase